MRTIVFAAALALAFPPLALAQTNPIHSPSSAFDTDHDGTVDLNEAQAAAKTKFTGMDVHHDGKLRAGQNNSTLPASSFKAADADHDGTVDAQEYQALVAKRFKAADKDNDGTLDGNELSSKRGHSLAKLLQQ